MDLKERHSLEKEYWDKQLPAILKDSKQGFKINNLYTFENLSEKIDYLKPVPLFWGNIINKRILDLACGDGWLSLSLGKSGAIVNGFDISPKRIELAKNVAKANGLRDAVKFEVMAAEEMTYENDYFDFAIVHASLHHCDIEKTSKEIHRVLKPGGKAILIEDYAYHPLMKLYRKLTPAKHTRHEKALDDDDIKIFNSLFSSYYFKYYGLFNLFETSNNSFIRAFKPFLKSIDNYLYQHIPSIIKYSKLVAIYVTK